MVDRLPRALGTVLNETGSGVSGGEAQRLALARAMLADADVVLADEPTEHLDEDTAHAIGTALIAHARQRNLIVATHDRRLMCRMHRVIDLAQLEPGSSGASAGGGRMNALAAMFAYFWRAERKWFLAGMAASAFTVLTSVALLGLAGWFISACALAGAGGIGLSFNFFQPSAAIRFLAIGRTVGRYAERLVTHDTTLRFLSTLRVDLFRGFARQPMQQLASLRSGQMLERITVDVDALDNLYLRLAMPVLVFAVTTSVLTATMLAVSLTLAMAVMALLLTAVSVVCTGGLLARKVAKRRAFALEALRVRTIDLVRAQTEFIVAGSLGLQQGKALDAAQRVAEASYRLQVLQLVADAVLSLMSATCLGAVFLLAASHFHRGDIDAPRLVLLVLVTLAAVECLGPLRRGVLEFSRTALAAKRVVPILKWPFAAGGPMQALTRPTVRLLDVEYRAAPKSAPLLQHITLCVEPGQRVAITGASGSGKSTLLALAAGVI